MSREWLKTPSASLSKLEGVHPVSYDVGLIQAKDLRIRSSRRIAKDVPYTQLEANPPLSSLLSQKTAWGSSTSIPDLIHQQEERKKQIQQKAPRRPWSGRKTPATSRNSTAKTAAEKEYPQNGPKISIHGSQYQPQSRPPSGRPLSGKSVLGSSKSESHGGIISEKQREDLLFYEFIACQEGYSSENVKDEQITPSPGHEKLPEGETKDVGSTSLAHPDEGTAKGKQGYQSPRPKLLRKPTPEPIRLSMTIPRSSYFIDDEEEEECQSSESCSIVEDDEDIEVQSVTSEVSASHIKPVSHEQTVTHGGVTRVSVTPRNDTPSKPSDPLEAIANDIKHILMCGDDAVNEKSKDEVWKRDEDVIELSKDKGNHPIERPSGHNSVEDHQPKLKHVPRPPRPQSSSHLKGRSRPVPKVELDYRDEDCQQKRTTKSSAKFKVTGSEVETMVSKLALNEKMDSGPSESDLQKVQEGNMAEYGKRTFQMSSSSFNKPFSELSGGSLNVLPETKLTTKTVEFSSEGIKENVAVSVIQKIPDKDKKKKPVFVPTRSPKISSKRNNNNSDLSKQGEGSSQILSEKVVANVETERMHSSVAYPMMINSMKISERPQSRMSHRDADSKLGFSDDERNISPHSSEKGNRSPRSSSFQLQTRNKINRQRPKSAGISSKAHGFRHRELQRASTSMKLHSNSARTLTPQPRRAVDIKRNREAVKSLRDGSLTSSKKYIQKDFPVEEIKPVSPSRRKVPSESDTDSSSSSDSDYDIPKSHQEEEVFAVRQKLRQRGVDVPFKMLKRGLLNPSERGYDECMSQLPQTSSLSLLNEPEVWLGKVFRKYKLAEKALQRANERMIIQAEMEAKDAAKEKAMTDTKTKKVKRRKRAKGGKRKAMSKVKTTGVT